MTLTTEEFSETSELESHLPNLFLGIEDVVNKNLIKKQDIILKPFIKVIGADNKTYNTLIPDDVEYGSLQLSSLEETISFDDVGGCEEAKKELKRIASSLKPENKKIYERTVVKRPKGVILYGLAGCGKSLLGKALAKEIDADLRIVRLSDLTGKWYGNEERMVNLLFDWIKGNPNYTILLIDEIDAVLPSRKEEVHEATKRMVSTFLSRINGLEEDTRGLIVGTTNYPERIDKAITRPGRLDKLIEIGLPNKSARKSIFEIHLKYRDNNLQKSEIEELAAITKDYTGADIEEVIRLSGQKVYDDYLDKKPVEYVITYQHIMNQIRLYKKKEENNNPLVT